MDLVQWIPLVAGLGVGTAFGNWVGQGRARREVRSEILQSIAMTEHARWSRHPDGDDYPEFVDAVRKLETAALIARIPRSAVLHYTTFAYTARYLSSDAVDFDPTDHSFFGDIATDFDGLVQDAGEILTRLAWRPWWTRVRLQVDLWGLRRRALRADAKILRRLADSQRHHGVLPGRLGRLPEIKNPPPHFWLTDDTGDTPSETDDP